MGLGGRQYDKPVYGPETKETAAGKPVKASKEEEHPLRKRTKHASLEALMQLEESIQALQANPNKAKDQRIWQDFALRLREVSDEEIGNLRSNVEKADPKTEEGRNLLSKASESLRNLRGIAAKVKILAAMTNVEKLLKFRDAFGGECENLVMDHEKRIQTLFGLKKEELNLISSLLRMKTPPRDLVNQLRALVERLHYQALYTSDDEVRWQALANIQRINEGISKLQLQFQVPSEGMEYTQGAYLAEAKPLADLIAVSKEHLKLPRLNQGLVAGFGVLRNLYDDYQKLAVFRAGLEKQNFGSRDLISQEFFENAIAACERQMDALRQAMRAELNVMSSLPRNQPGLWQEIIRDPIIAEMISTLTEAGEGSEELQPIRKMHLQMVSANEAALKMKSLEQLRSELKLAKQGVASPKIQEQRESALNHQIAILERLKEASEVVKKHPGRVSEALLKAQLELQGWEREVSEVPSSERAGNVSCEAFAAFRPLFSFIVSRDRLCDLTLEQQKKISVQPTTKQEAVQLGEALSCLQMQMICGLHEDSAAASVNIMAEIITLQNIPMPEKLSPAFEKARVPDLDRIYSEGYLKQHPVELKAAFFENKWGSHAASLKGLVDKFRAQDYLEEGERDRLYEIYYDLLEAEPNIDVAMRRESLDSPMRVVLSGILKRLHDLAEIKNSVQKSQQLREVELKRSPPPMGGTVTVAELRQLVNECDLQVGFLRAQYKSAYDAYQERVGEIESKYGSSKEEATVAYTAAKEAYRKALVAFHAAPSPKPKDVVESLTLASQKHDAAGNLLYALRVDIKEAYRPLEKLASSNKDSTVEMQVSLLSAIKRMQRDESTWKQLLEDEELIKQLDGLMGISPGMKVAELSKTGAKDRVLEQIVFLSLNGYIPLSLDEEEIGDIYEKAINVLEEDSRSYDAAVVRLALKDEAILNRKISPEALRQANEKMYIGKKTTTETQGEVKAAQEVAGTPKTALPTPSKAVQKLQSTAGSFTAEDTATFEDLWERLQMLNLLPFFEGAKVTKLPEHFMMIVPKLCNNVIQSSHQARSTRELLNLIAEMSKSQQLWNVILSYPGMRELIEYTSLSLQQSDNPVLQTDGLELKLHLTADPALFKEMMAGVMEREKKSQEAVGTVVSEEEDALALSGPTLLYHDRMTRLQVVQKRVPKT